MIKYALMIGLIVPPVMFLMLVSHLSDPQPDGRSADDARKEIWEKLPTSIFFKLWLVLVLAVLGIITGAFEWIVNNIFLDGRIS